MSHVEFRKGIVRGLIRKLRNYLAIQPTEIKEKKRKPENEFPVESLGDCALGLLSQQEGRKSNRAFCQVHKDEGLKGEKVLQTSYLCLNCVVPVCLIPCYDAHRSLARKLKLVSKTLEL